MHNNEHGPCKGESCVRKSLASMLKVKAKTISKQLDVPVTTVANIIKKFEVHGTVANLP